MRRSDGPDPVLATLRAAAHEAVDRGDAAAVEAYMRAIERHRAAVASEAAEQASTRGVA